MTLAKKLSGRTIDAVYCKTCGIQKGIYLLRLPSIGRKIEKAECPRCNGSMFERIEITIHGG